MFLGAITNIIMDYDKNFGLWSRLTPAAGHVKILKFSLILPDCIVSPDLEKMPISHPKMTKMIIFLVPQLENVKNRERM